MDYLKRQKRLEAFSKIGCLLIGIVSDLLFFYLSILIDSWFNTFENASMHIIYVPIIFSFIFIYLECKFISESVKPDALFIFGNMFGIFLLFKHTFYIPNTNNFIVDDYILYNLVRYFTPAIVFIMSNIILYLIRRLIFQYRVYMAQNYVNIQRIIEENNKNFDENYYKNEDITLEEEPKDLLEIAHKHVGKLSDIIGKSIDPDYKRDDDK